MQVFSFHQTGEPNSAALDRVQTDRETQMRLVSVSSTCSQDGGARLQGARNGEGAKQEQWKKDTDRDQYGLTITPVSAGSNGQPYCISPGWFSLMWRGRNPSNAFDISVQPNRSSTQKKKAEGLEDQRRRCCAAVKQFPENGLLFNMLMIHMKNLLLLTGIFPSSSNPEAPGAERPLLNESFDYCLAIT